MEQGKVVVAVSISRNKGERKIPVDLAELLENHGIVCDAHAGDWHRQVSLLAPKSITKMRALGFGVSIGDFAENITMQGIDPRSLPGGTRLALGENILEATRLDCHTNCDICPQARDCVMPAEEIFAGVWYGGTLKPADGIEGFSP